MERLRFTIHRHVNLKIMKTLLRAISMRETKLFTGTDATAELAAYIASSGKKNALIVTTNGAVKRVQISKLTQALEKEGVNFSIYDGVIPDPNFSTVTAGLNIQKQHNSDVIIPFGGGSAIDTARAIAVAATNNKPINKLIGFRKGSKEPLPLYAVPTTSGTASEVTNVAVISTDDTHSKKFLIDSRTISIAAALDPELTASLTPAVTAETGMDALTHALEGYLSQISSPEDNRLAIDAIQSIFEHLPEAYKNGSNLEARQAMAIAALTAGRAFRKSCLGYVHAIFHQLGSVYGTAHGLGNAILLPRILAYSSVAATEKLAKLALELGLGYTSMPRETLAQLMVDQVQQLNKQLSIPIRVPGLKKEDIPTLANKAHAEAMEMHAGP